MWRVEDLLDEANRENTKQNTAKIQNEMLRKYKTKHRENAKQATFYGYTQRLPSSAQDRKMDVEWRLDAAATPFDGGMSSLP